MFNWKLALGLVGGYLLVSHLRKSGAVTINKENPAGKVLDDAANTGDKIAAVGAQVKDAIEAKISGEPAGTQPAPADADAAALSTIF